ncbi:hypothetical protein [Microbacterium sp.]|uniref:hypothetical protein n=1 Tax=Microbacterium sp. TaxID=51671 RepID=UPI003A8DB1AD
MAESTMRASSKVGANPEFWTRVREEPAFAAFWILRVGFVVLPLWMGIDKFINSLTDWPGYLAPWIVHILPFSAQTAMYLVGVVEIIAAIAVAIKPRYASYVVALWLLGIIVNLLTWSGFYDVALRDFGLLVAALALSRLAAVYDQPWGAKRR